MVRFQDHTNANVVLLVIVKILLNGAIVIQVRNTIKCTINIFTNPIIVLILLTYVKIFLGFDSWLSDGGDIREKEHLPIKQVRFGDTGTPLDEKEGRFKVGPLMCEGDGKY